MARTKVYYRLRKEYNSTEGEELKQDNKTIEKIIKLYMLEVLEHDLEYYYKSVKFILHITNQ